MMRRKLSSTVAMKKKYLKHIQYVLSFNMDRKVTLIPNCLTHSIISCTPSKCLKKLNLHSDPENLCKYKIELNRTH